MLVTINLPKIEYCKRCKGTGTIRRSNGILGTGSSLRSCRECRGYRITKACAWKMIQFYEGKRK